ncbi:hypothetical protein [Mycolicibacterium chubuense]|nr:hypothetical protein [Mycolicibacterium chubuense]
MNKFIAAGLLPVAALLALSATAQAEPSPSGSSQGPSATETINQLKSQGLDVRVNRIGSGPMDKCTVANISRAVTQPPIIPAFDWHDVNVFTRYPQPVVTVTLNCSR